MSGQMVVEPPALDGLDPEQAPSATTISASDAADGDLPESGVDSAADGDIDNTDATSAGAHEISNNTDNNLSSEPASDSAPTPSTSTASPHDEPPSPDSRLVSLTSDGKIISGDGATPPDASVSTAPTADAPVASSNTPAHAGDGADNDEDQSVYQVKWSKFHSLESPVITQNENGPCPLLAIVNVLLLRGKMKIPPGTSIVTYSQLMSLLWDCILTQTPQHISAGERLNYEKNMNDAMAVIHKLQTGLDVNVKFTGVADFEYTIESIIFDLLNISLYHGWLVDPQSPETEAALGSYSYNQIVERIIANKASPKPELVTEALIAEDFLENTRSQLSYHGICELHKALKEGELAVFFRNNHFSTIYKQKEELFLLVTDQGFVNEPKVMWETLANVEGDGHFVDQEFNTFTPQTTVAHQAAPVLTRDERQQIDADLLVALSMRDEMEKGGASAGSKPAGAGVAAVSQDSGRRLESVEPAAVAATTTMTPQELADHQLAVALQHEEQERLEAMMNQERGSGDGARSETATGGNVGGRCREPGEAGRESGGTQGRRPREVEAPEKKEKDCVIL